MSYFIEFGQSLYEAFYQEFLVLDGETDAPLPSNGIDHQLKILGDACDYGDCYASAQTVASNSNGLIYATTQPGVSAIKAPVSAFGVSIGCDDYGFNSSPRRTLRCALIAVPPLAADAKTLFTGRITFGDMTTMPRVTLKATPFYPAPQVPSPSVTQVKIQLVAQFGNFDDVEAGLPSSPLDPARLAWVTGGQVTIGSPLANAIQAIKAWNAAAMAIFLTAAAGQVT